MGEPEDRPEAGEKSRAGKRRGGRCCLWGCVGFTAACLAAILGLVTVFFYIGVPWLEQKESELVERFPVLGAVLERMPVQDNLQRLQEGSTGREDFPRDIYIPEDLIAGAFRTSEARAVARLRLPPTDLRSLAASYRREMGRLGWNREPVPDPKEGIRLRFSRPGRKLHILLRRDPDAVSVWIRHDRTE
ncbi:MAG: hypothetical protein ACC742_12465 [Thermoanaerobaculales bacterium]